MRLYQLNDQEQGLTLVEVFVVLAAIWVILWLVMATMSPSGREHRLRCVSNLKDVGLAFRVFEADNGGLFPMQLSTNQRGSIEFVAGGNAFRHFLVLSNELSTPRILVCPADSRSAAKNFAGLRNEHLSYFVGLDARTNCSQVLLAGDRNITNTTPPAEGIMMLTTNQIATRGVGWTKAMHRHAGNVVFVDGHVDQMGASRLQDQIRDAEISIQRIALP